MCVPVRELRSVSRRGPAMAPKTRLSNAEIANKVLRSTQQKPLSFFLNKADVPVLGPQEFWKQQAERDQEQAALVAAEAELNAANQPPVVKRRPGRPRKGVQVARAPVQQAVRKRRRAKLTNWF